MSAPPRPSRLRPVPRGADPAVVRSAAAAAATLGQLAAAASGCRVCPGLAGTRHSVVVGDTPAGTRLALVGEAPGATEDLTGRPFVGRAGALLDRLLIEVGLQRPQVAVLNVVKCRPPGNRAPARSEVESCRGWLDRQLELLDPALTVALGGTAAGWFLGRGVRLSGVRGRVHIVAGRRVVATYHPSAAIRFGPAGAPLAALRADLAHVAGLLA